MARPARHAYHSRLKQWLRRFNGVASSYLANYLGWLRALARRGRGTQDSAWLLTLAVKVEVIISQRELSLYKAALHT